MFVCACWHCGHFGARPSTPHTLGGLFALGAVDPSNVRGWVGLARPQQLACQAWRRAPTIPSTSPPLSRWA